MTATAYTPDTRYAVERPWMVPGGVIVEEAGVVIVGDGGDREAAADAALHLSTRAHVAEATRRAALHAGMHIGGHA